MLTFKCKCHMPIVVNRSGVIAYLERPLRPVGGVTHWLAAQPGPYQVEEVGQQPGVGQPGQAFLAHVSHRLGQRSAVGEGDNLFSVCLIFCLAIIATCSKTFCRFLIILLALTNQKKSMRWSTWKTLSPRRGPPESSPPSPW